MKKEISLIVATAVIICVLFFNADKNWGYLGFFAAFAAEWLVTFLIALCGRDYGKYIPVFIGCSIAVGGTAMTFCFEDISIMKLCGLLVIVIFATLLCIGFLAAIEFYNDMHDSRKESYDDSWK